MSGRPTWTYGAGIIGYHALAVAALLPYFFSWSGVVTALLGVFVFGTLGINLCYHRLLTHRGLICPKWFEHSLAILGVCSVQDTPAHWVSVHRRHHQHSDKQPDPHSPLAGLLWSHMGWLLLENRELGRLGIYQRYAKDILADPFYAALERRGRWVQIVLLSWIVFFVAGFVGAAAMGSNLPDAFRIGMSLLIWGVFVRTVVVWHITWSVNSFAHVWGYQRYETGEASRNNLIVGYLSNGEGWHNNHHADPRSARHGHVWWELDVTWLTIRLLGALGLARRVATPRRALMDQATGKRATMPNLRHSLLRRDARTPAFGKVSAVQVRHCGVISDNILHRRPAKR
jgi:stearoyl-CoA desaturase (delta-9 desaturase)